MDGSRSRGRKTTGVNPWQIVLLNKQCSCKLKSVNVLGVLSIAGSQAAPAEKLTNLSSMKKSEINKFIDILFKSDKINDIVKTIAEKILVKIQEIQDSQVKDYLKEHKYKADEDKKHKSKKKADSEKLNTEETRAHSKNKHKKTHRKPKQSKNNKDFPEDNKESKQYHLRHDADYKQIDAKYFDTKEESAEVNEKLNQIEEETKQNIVTSVKLPAEKKTKNYKLYPHMRAKKEKHQKNTVHDSLSNDDKSDTEIIDDEEENNKIKNEEVLRTEEKEATPRSRADDRIAKPSPINIDNYETYVNEDSAEFNSYLGNNGLRKGNDEPVIKVVDQQGRKVYALEISPDYDEYHQMMLEQSKSNKT